MIKNKIFLKKQIKNLLKTKKFQFKLEIKLQYIKVIKLLSKNTILILCQFLSLNSEKDANYYLNVLDNKYNNIFLSKILMRNIFDKNILLYLKNFNNILCLNNLYDIKNIEIKLKENNILILGYYFNNILFSKSDLKIKNIKKIEIYKNIKKLDFLIKNLIKKLVFSINYKILKILFLLKKKKI